MTVPAYDARIPNITALREAPVLASSVNALDCGSRKFETSSPLDHLYKFACSHPSTLEGRAALEGALRLNTWYRENNIERVSDAEMNERIQSMLSWASTLFDTLDTRVHAVVFYGSFLRGRPDCKDVDVKILTTYESENPLSNYEFAVENRVEKEIREATEEKITLAIAGVPIQNGEIFICSQYESHYGASLHIVEDSPFLCLVRPEIQSGDVGAFFYLAGTKYLERRDKPMHY